MEHTLGETRNILIVDRELGIRNALKRTFRQEYRSFSATNGRDALSIMEENNIALVITDHRIPGMTGIEFLEKVSREYPDTICIILTAYMDENLHTDAIAKVKVHRYLAKPWETDELKQVVRESLESRYRQVRGKLKRKV